jgi:hypothetical protein
VVRLLLLSFFLLLSILDLMAITINVGDGSDGICNDAFITANGAGTYNCTEVEITAIHNLSGATPLILKATGTVLISGTINLDGADGGDGTNSTIADIAGGVAGAGGNDGGDYPNGLNSGLDGAETTVGSAGEGGELATGTCLTSGDAGGGGGGGGNGSAGSIGGPASTASQAAGGAVLMENLLITLIGGAGGGAGGCAYQGFPAFGSFSGGAGGGGGGAVRITADEAVTLSGTITANGGAGGDGNTFSGGGGGGAGGSIVIQSQVSIDVTGTLSITAGAAGTNGGGTGGAGGDGGYGRIRLDALDGRAGVDISSATINPGAVTIEYNAVDPITLNFSSDINCALQEHHTLNWASFFSFLCGVLLVTVIGGFKTSNYSRYSN